MVAPRTQKQESLVYTERPISEPWSFEYEKITKINPTKDDESLEPFHFDKSRQVVCFFTLRSKHRRRKIFLAFNAK